MEPPVLINMSCAFLPLQPLPLQAVAAQCSGGVQLSTNVGIMGSVGGKISVKLGSLEKEYSKDPVTVIHYKKPISTSPCTSLVTRSGHPLPPPPKALRDGSTPDWQEQGYTWVGQQVGVVM